MNDITDLRKGVDVSKSFAVNHIASFFSYRKLSALSINTQEYSLFTLREFKSYRGHIF